MKKIIIIFFFIPLVGHMKSYGQENSKGINFVITVDDNVVVGSFAHLRLIVDDVNDKHKAVEASYVPGELTINKVDVEEMLSDKANKISLAFDYYEYCKEKQIIHNYEIEMDKNWLHLSFIVLRIYNLDKKKYSKMFYPLEGRNYTYEIDFPSNSMTRVKKKGSKNG